MSVAELAEFKKSVRNDLKTEGIEWYEFSANADELMVEEDRRIRDLLRSNAHLLQECPQIDPSTAISNYTLQEPFAVIASGHRDTERDVRSYPFGTAKGTNPLHSDFPSLCQLIINRSPEYLREAALEKFQAWTQQVSAARRKAHFQATFAAAL